MDVWIVAAAAGAGYVAQHLKSLGRGKNKWLDSSAENLNNVRPQSSIIRHKPGDRSDPFHSVLSGKSLGEEMSNKEGDEVCEDDSDFAVTSTSGYEGENVVMEDSFNSYGTVSNLSSLAPLVDEEDVQGNREVKLPYDSSKGLTGDLLPHPSSSEIGFSYSFRRKKSSLRSRRFDSKFIKPRTSLESCLMAQLYEERSEREGYALYPLGKPLLRPFLVTDGSRILSKVPHESFIAPIGTAAEKFELQKDGYSKVNATVCGIPRLPNISPVEFEKKAKAREKMNQASECIDSSKAGIGDHDNAQGATFLNL